jgi:hypothetical protein
MAADLGCTLQELMQDSGRRQRIEMLEGDIPMKKVRLDLISVQSQVAALQGCGKKCCFMK